MIVPETVITCCHKDCGISFAVPSWWEKGKRENHSWWYCPNGHHQHFPAESDIDKMRRERDRALQQIARAEEETAEANRRAVKFERDKKRLEKRAATGTCPCCQRSFSNVRAHLNTKHPEFVAENVVPLKKKA